MQCVLLDRYQHFAGTHLQNLSRLRFNNIFLGLTASSGTSNSPSSSPLIGFWYYWTANLHYLHTHSHKAGFVRGPELVELLDRVRRWLFLAAIILVYRECLAVSDPNDGKACGLWNAGVFWSIWHDCQHQTILVTVAMTALRYTNIKFVYNFTSYNFCAGPSGRAV